MEWKGRREGERRSSIYTCAVQFVMHTVSHTLSLQAFILVCLVAWFSKTETCHQLMTHLFQSDVTTLSDAPSPLELPLPPPVTPPIHSKLNAYIIVGDFVRF